MFRTYSMALSRRKAFGVMLCLAALSLTFACQNHRKVYRKPLANPIQTLDPKAVRLRVDYMIARNIFGQFLTYDPSGNIQPGVFKHWHTPDNGLTYTFHIDPKAKFHDGKPVTVEDVIFSFHYLAAGHSLVSSYFSNVLGHLEYAQGIHANLTGIQATGPQTITIKLHQPSQVFLTKLADPKLVLLPAHLRHQSEKQFFEHPIGAGPYRVVSLNPDHTHLVLQRFEGYHAKKSNIKTYDLRTYDKETAKNHFLTGQLEDLEAFSLSQDELETLKPYAHFYSNTDFKLHVLLLNGCQTWLHDIQVRRALSQAINMKALVGSLNKQIIPIRSLIPQGLLGCEEIRTDSSSYPALPCAIKEKRPLRILHYNTLLNPSLLDGIMKQLALYTPLKPCLIESSERGMANAFQEGHYDLLYEIILVRCPEPYNIFSYFDHRSRQDLIRFQDTHISQSLMEAESMSSQRRSMAYTSLSDYITQEQCYAIPLFMEIQHHAFSKAVKPDVSPATLLGNTPFERVSL